MSAKLREGLAHQQAMRFVEAAAAYREVLKAQPNHPDALHFLGLALWQITQDTDEPLRLIKKSMTLAPDQPQMHHNLATVLGAMGHIDEAVANYRRAIELKPDYAEAYFNLSGVVKFKTGDDDVARMKALYAQMSLGDEDHEYLCYGLSKAMNDLGQYDEAFHFALEGARIKAPAHNQAGVETIVKEARDVLSRDVLAHNPHDAPQPDSPIFIVGMPRSGTTLVEQILSRHDDVFAAGELPMIGAINGQMQQWARKERGYQGSLQGHLPLMPDEHFHVATKACYDMVHERAQGRVFTRFTDKMPQNAFWLGLVARMFPNARIIHVRRHPLDTCVSCFFQRFRVGHEYSYRLDWLGHYYRQYADIMAHWQAVLPLPVLEVRYEALVRDPEGEARRLVEFVGLDWREACLRPQDSDRSVMTASRWQVRQPIYTSSLERWHRYETWLDPLIEALGGREWIEEHATG